jgi:hypothetical protein
MDWIDTPAANGKKTRTTSSVKQKRSVSLEKRVKAVLSHPTELWLAGFEHGLAAIKWPQGCDASLTWVWSTVIMEQAQVLCRAGVSPSNLANAVIPAATGKKSKDSVNIAGLSELMTEPLESLAFTWLDEADCYPQSALGIIATLWHLPEQARRIDGGKLADWLKAVAQRTAEHSSQQSDCLLGNLVFHCELPLLLDLLTASPKFAVGALASQAMDDLAEYLENSQEHIGSWLAHGGTYLRAALACVFRCRILADHLGLRRWYAPQRKALGSLLVQAARWTKADGTQMFGHGLSGKLSRSQWNALSKLASTTRKQRQTLELSQVLKGEGGKSRGNTELPELSVNDEQAACGLMGGSWKQTGSRVAIDFSEATTQIEALGPKGCSILRGDWPVIVSMDGQSLYQLDGWEQVCWFSDSDISYLEIECQFGETAKVQRQIMLFHKQRLMLAADALLADQSGQWLMTSELPLATQTNWQSNGKNTEGFLIQNNSQCLVLPLFMSEWKKPASSGKVEVSGNRLIVTNSCSQASRIYSPILIALCNRFSQKPYTWRQLTVAENLRIVGKDEAVGIRVQLAKEQILLYRNLAKATRRTVLGVHLMSDFFAGLFDKDSGEAETLVEIEASN